MLQGRGYFVGRGRADLRWDVDEMGRRLSCSCFLLLQFEIDARKVCLGST